MIQIQQVIIRHVSMEMVTPFESSSSSIQTKEALILEVFDQSGIVVFSECVARHIPDYLPETIDTSFAVLTKHILPLIIGQSFDTPSAMTHTIQRYIRGHYMAVAALDMAAWAIVAVQQNQSLSQTIGGVRSEIECGIAIGLEASPDVLVETVASEFNKGYKKIKCKIKPGKDVAYIQAVRQELGPDIPLMVDANNAYQLDDLDQLKALDDFHLMMIEQPLAWDDIWQHQTLQQSLKTPICLDESILTYDHAKMAIEFGSAQVINIKPGRVGGFSEAIRIHDLCRDRGVPVWCGGMLETGIGRAYNVALASMEHFSIPGDISPSSRYWIEDIVEPEWTMTESGRMQVPNGVGLGITIKRAFLDSITMYKEII